MSAQDFVTEAASGGLFEVRSSEMAIEQAQSEDVRGFAQMMITDHSAANEQLASIDGELDLTVSEEIHGSAAQFMADVEGAPADGFDATYMAARVAAHEATIALFETYAESGDETQLVNFAQSALPTLQSHLKMAQAVEGE